MNIRIGSVGKVYILSRLVEPDFAIPTLIDGYKGVRKTDHHYNDRSGGKRSKFKKRNKR